MNLRDINESDCEAIAQIYNHYVKTTTITFEEQPVSGKDIKERVQKVAGLGLPWLVAEEKGKVIGYAYATQWNTRTAYRYTVEPSVYLSPDVVSKGIGRQLYTCLLDTLKRQGIKNVISVITLPNPSSSGFHESFGFQKVGEFANIGVKFGRKLSVGYWQLELND